MLASVTMKGWSLKRAMKKPLNQPTASPISERDEDRGRDRHVGLEPDGQQPGEGHHRADREVDAAGQDHQQHAEAQEAVGDHLPRDVHHVAFGQERIGDDARDDHQRHDGNGEADVGAIETRAGLVFGATAVVSSIAAMPGLLTPPRRPVAGRVGEERLHRELLAREFGADPAPRA